MKRTDSVAEQLRRALDPTEQQKADALALNSGKLLGLAAGEMPADTRRILAELIRKGFEESVIDSRNE